MVDRLPEGNLPDVQRFVAAILAANEKEREDVVKKARPRLRLTQREFDCLPEYSTTVPTGTTIGKRWKRRSREGWHVGEYYDIGSKTEVGIYWYDVDIVDTQEAPHGTR